MPFGPYWRLRERTDIDWPKIHSYAANRWLNAKTKCAARFWRRIMNLCIQERASWTLDHQAYRQFWGQN